MDTKICIEWPAVVERRGLLASFMQLAVEIDNALYDSEKDGKLSIYIPVHRENAMYSSILGVPTAIIINLRDRSEKGILDGREYYLYHKNEQARVIAEEDAECEGTLEDCLKFIVNSVKEHFS